MNDHLATQQPKLITLPGGVGTILVPTDLAVQDEGDSALLFYPGSDRLIEIRCSVLTATKIDAGENELKSYLERTAAEKGGTYSEIGEAGVGEWVQEHTSDSTVVRSWACAVASWVVIFVATYVRSDDRSPVVARTLSVIPEIIKSIRPLKSTRVIDVAGNTVEIKTTQIPDMKPLHLRPFGPDEDMWLRSALNDARQLWESVDGSDGTSPSTLDRILSRSMRNENYRQSMGMVANALAAAFGSYLGDKYGYHWMVSSDEYGEEYVLQQNEGETVIYVVRSVQRRLASGETDFFEKLERGLVQGLVDVSLGGS